MCAVKNAFFFFSVSSFTCLCYRKAEDAVPTGASSHHSLANKALVSTLLIWNASKWQLSQMCFHPKTDIFKACGMQLNYRPMPLAMKALLRCFALSSFIKQQNLKSCTDAQALGHIPQVPTRVTTHWSSSSTFFLARRSSLALSLRSRSYSL